MKYLSWGGLSDLHRLPITRVATLLPVIGYLILFSDAIPDLFKYVEFLDVNQIISQDCRLKLLYFGGLLIAASMVLHFLFCPAAPRRYSDLFDLRDQFVRFGAPTDVANAMLESASKEYLFKRQTTHFEGIKQHLKSYISLTRGDRAEQVFETDFYSDLLAGIKGDTKFDKAKRLEAFIVIFGPAVEFHKSQTDDWAIREVSINLLSLYFDASNRSRPIILSLALLIAGIGSIMVLIPALETALLVILSMF